jgi:protease-4
MANNQVIPQKKHHRWIPVLIICGLCLIVLCCVGSCAASLFGGSSSKDLTAGFPSNTIAVIPIDGTIGYDGSSCSPEGLKSLLDQAENNPNVGAVVLRVNSGGGAATAGEEMARYVHDFSKPIIVSSASLNASAAYEISSQADQIFVAQTTEIGAIGTDLSLTNYSGLMKTLGVEVDNITSTESKDSSYGTRPLTDEERAYYQDLVNKINEVFINNVASGRSMDTQAVRALATGMPFAGTDALTNGLADHVGTLEDACAAAAESAGYTSSYHTEELNVQTSSSLWGLLKTLVGSSSYKDILTGNTNGVNGVAKGFGSNVTAVQ